MITTMPEPNIDQPQATGQAVETPLPQAGPLARHVAELGKRAERLVVEHPKHSLLAALVAGVILGWIIKRR